MALRSRLLLQRDVLARAACSKKSQVQKLELASCKALSKLLSFTSAVRGRFGAKFAEKHTRRSFSEFQAFVQAGSLQLVLREKPQPSDAES